jgi:hypothetical protein
VFHVDVAKVDRDIAYFASVSEECCKSLFKIFHLFSRRMFANVFYLDVARVCSKDFTRFSLMLQ